MPTYNDSSVKEYDKISKYKDLEIEIEKCDTLKIPPGAQDTIMKGTNKHEQNTSQSQPIWNIKNCTQKKQQKM